MVVIIENTVVIESSQWLEASWLVLAERIGPFPCDAQ